MFDVMARDETLVFLETSMDLLSLRHSLIAGNIANADTPGYHAVDLEFSRELQVAFERQRNTEFEAVGGASLRYEQVLQPRIVEVTGTTHRLDGNTVDLDREMVKLAISTGIYSQATKMMSMKIRMLKAAIAEQV